MRGQQPAASCREVTKIYKRRSGDTRALDGVSADIAPSALTVLMGPSGSGKSTLLRIIAGLDHPTSGSVEVGSSWLSEMSTRDRRAFRRRNIGYVFQRPPENLISYLTVMEHMELSAGIRGATHHEAEDLLALLGIDHRAGNRPHQLSGGEQQRLAFAQAAIGAPALVVADEPTAELDSASALHLMEVIRKLAERGSSIVVATHDPDVAKESDAIVRIEQGRVMA